MNKYISILFLVFSTSFVLASGLNEFKKMENKNSTQVLVKRYKDSSKNNTNAFACTSKKYCELKFNQNSKAKD